MYCWVVEDDRPLDAGSIAGVPDGEWTVHRLAMRTLPEHVFVDLVPGIGPTSFVYGHHGTPAGVDVRLIEVAPAIERR